MKTTPNSEKNQREAQIGQPRQKGNTTNNKSFRVNRMDPDKQTSGTQDFVTQQINQKFNERETINSDEINMKLALHAQVKQGPMVQDSTPLRERLNLQEDNEPIKDPGF